MGLTSCIDRLKFYLTGLYCIGTPPCKRNGWSGQVIDEDFRVKTKAFLP